MFGIGWIEVAIVMTLGVFFMTVFLTIFTVVMRQRQSSPLVPSPVSFPQARQPAASQPVDYGEASALHVARITQRFCPRCRTRLSADAPEGLCPACLLAGGMASAAAMDAVNGLAVTTPPSGSQPPATGEWANLEQHFPQLEILELLGRGGMGAVYKARQKNLDRLVALKVIPPEAAKDPAFAERFAREARALARLNHPNIVTVYDFGQAGEVYYLLMEYVDGVNLRHAQQAARLAPAEALAIVPPICDALQYAHDQGVVHRDIKPENVLLDRSGRVKIADFGLAKLLGKGPADFTLTGTQQVMGTPKYMAPEQIERPTAVDHRADIYSLGVVIYEMLTGELPIGRFQPPSEKVEVDVRIDQVVLRALEKEPERRYQRASHVKTDLATAAPPVWQTPAPAFKHGALAPSTSVELGPILAVAIGMVLGVLAIAAGIAAGMYGVAVFPFATDPWWGCMGAAFGCILGGLGSLFGSYNSYRQLGGAEDLMRAPARTWFDWAMGGYFLFGLLLMLTGAFTGGANPSWRHLWMPMLIMSIVVVFQGVLFLLLRALLTQRQAVGGVGPARLNIAAADLAGPLPKGDKPPPWDQQSEVKGANGSSTLAAVLIGSVVLAIALAGAATGFYMFFHASPNKAGPILSAAASDFDKMVSALGSESSDQGKLSFIKLVCRDNTFTSDQARRLLAEFDFDPGREEAAVVLYPRVTDQKNYFLALETFTYDPGRGNVVRRLGLDRPPTPEAAAEKPSQPLMRPEFARLLNSVSQASFDEGKLSVIRIAIREGLLSSDQARQLLEEFSYDEGPNGREAAALLIYPRLSDPKNFYLVLESFDYDDTRNSVRQRLKLD